MKQARLTMGLGIGESPSLARREGGARGGGGARCDSRIVLSPRCSPLLGIGSSGHWIWIQVIGTAVDHPASHAIGAGDEKWPQIDDVEGDADPWCNAHFGPSARWIRAASGHHPCLPRWRWGRRSSDRDDPRSNRRASRRACPVNFDTRWGSAAVEADGVRYHAEA